MILNEVENWLSEIEVEARQQETYALLHNEPFNWSNKQKKQAIRNKFSQEAALLSTQDIHTSVVKPSTTIHDLSLVAYDLKTNLVSNKLALEIALNKKLYEKLHKLLQSDASYKCLIIQKPEVADFESAFESIKSFNSTYFHRVNSLMMVACWLEEEQSFISQTLVLRRYDKTLS